MNRISLCAMSAAVVMTACTDYRAQINEAHDEYAREHNPSSLPFYSGCQCDVLQYNMYKVGDKEYNFINPKDASAAENHTIRFVLSDCNDEIADLSPVNQNFSNIVNTTTVNSQGSGTYWIDNDLNVSYLGIEYPETVEMKVYASNSAGALDLISCPAVHINADVKTSTSSQTSTQTSSTTTVPTSYVCGNMWCGPTDNLGQVMTNLEYEKDYDSETSGYWFDFGDYAGFEGTSSISFPPEVEANEYDNFYGPLIEAYGGIKGTVTLGPGYEYPYAGLGFNLLSGDQEGADIDFWKGLCLVYQSTINFSVELVPENAAVVTEYNNYKASVPASKNKMTVLDLDWSKFRQESGWGVTVPREEVLANVATIQLKFSGTAGTTGDFLIQSIGTLGSCHSF